MSHVRAHTRPRRSPALARKRRLLHQHGRVTLTILKNKGYNRGEEMVVSETPIDFGDSVRSQGYTTMAQCKELWGATAGRVKVHDYLDPP